MIDQEGIKIDSRLIDQQDKIHLIKLGGYVDQNNVHLLQNSIDENLNSSHYKIIFDLRNLAYMSSAGWGVLIGEIKRFRENGGDIKLINMGPEVFEIYQMLEFYHIIAEYPSLEEAKKGFSSNRELRLLNDASSRYNPESSESKKFEEDNTLIQNENNRDSEIQENPLSADKSDNGQLDTGEKEIEFDFDVNSDKELDQFESKRSNIGYIEFNPLSMERNIDPVMLPLPEKVRKIVGQFPQLGIRQIKKALRHPDYGGVKIGFFKLRSLLKDLDLDTKEKRFRYYKSI